MQDPKPQHRSSPEANALADAELGGLFRKMLERLSEVERAHLRKKPRTASDVRKMGNASLGIIGEALRLAKEGGHSDIDNISLPWPLFALFFELGDVTAGHFSRLLVPDSNKDAAKQRSGRTPATNTLTAHMQAFAVEAFGELLAGGWNRDKAASQIKKVFEECNVKANGKFITPGTVKGWVQEANKPSSRNARLLTEARKTIREAIDEIRGARDFVPSEELLYSLRRHVSCLAYS